MTNLSIRSAVDTEQGLVLFRLSLLAARSAPGSMADEPHVRTKDLGGGRMIYKQ